MNFLIRVSLICVIAAFTASNSFAADSPPVLGKPGKLLAEDDFSRAELAPKWKLGKGFWEIKDGVVIAAENPADHHGAYAHLNPYFPYKDIVAEFSFKLDGSKNCHFMMSDTTYKGSHAGHILRATILPTQVQLSDLKTGAMKLEIYEKNLDPKTTAEEKKQLRESIKDKTTTFKVDLDLAKWHQARVEVVGDEMVISIDGKPAGYLKSEGVDHPAKNMIGFTVGGKSTELDNLKVWEATLAPDWTTHRAEIVASLRK
jgi:hypothetical protein